MSRLRLAVVGAGHLGRIHARLASNIDQFELVAVVDPVSAAREVLAEELGIASVADVSELSGQFDAAVIATPTQFHHAVGQQLLEQGIHLLVEKPIASELSEAEELVAAAKNGGALLQVGHIERFNPALSVARPHINQPKYIEAKRYSGYTFRSVDIGVVLDLMIHDIDVVLSLVQSEVVAVEALGVAVMGEHEDAANARLTFANGCVANLNASRVSYQPAREMQLWGPGSFVDIDFSNASAKVVRPCDSLVNGSFNQHALSLEHREQIRDHLFETHLPITELKAEPRNAIVDELTDFAESIEQGRQPQVTGEAGRDALAVAEQILASIESHAWNGTEQPSLSLRADYGSSIEKGPHFNLPAQRTSAPRREAG